ncbi:MAG: hypothetical protein IJD93_02120 [Ruminococcus sp.]|nr:hypothetical protein [Ruminococcus sp.]
MKNFNKMIKLIFKAVSLAMGVAVVAMMIMDAIAVEKAVLLLGIGLACASIERLIKLESE